MKNIESQSRLRRMTNIAKYSAAGLVLTGSIAVLYRDCSNTSKEYRIEQKKIEDMCGGPKKPNCYTQEHCSGVPSFGGPPMNPGRVCKIEYTLKPGTETPVKK